MQKGRNTGINAALISALFLGFAPVFGKAAMGVGKFSPYAVVALRTGMAALLLLLIMFVWKRKYLYIYPAGLLGCLLAGAVNGIGLHFLLHRLEQVECERGPDAVFAVSIFSGILAPPG